MGVIRLARRWEARLKIKKRLQRGEPWIRLPDPPEAPPADDENASDDEGLNNAGLNNAGHELFSRGGVGAKLL